jgi:hypothetical protein
MEHQCPICQNKLEPQENKILYQDYVCRYNLDSHSFIYRYRPAVNEVAQLKVRITDDDGSKLYFKVYYDQDRSEVWTRTNDNQRINIEHAFVPDYSDLDKLKQKIRTYIIFS